MTQDLICKMIHLTWINVNFVPGMCEYTVQADADHSITLIESQVKQPNQQ